MFDYIYIFAVLVIEFLLLRFCLIKNIRQGTVLNIFYLFYYIFQGLLSCIILYLDHEFLLANSDNNFAIPIKDSILPYCKGTLIAIVGIIIGMSLSNKIYKNTNKKSWIQMVQLLYHYYNVDRFCVILSLVFSFSILVSLIPSYLISALSLTFAFSPLFVGIVWSGLNDMTKNIWKCILFVTFIFHTLQGSRGLAIFPIVAFLIGYLFCLSSNKKKLNKVLRLYVVIGFVSVPFLGFVQDYRDHFGRGNEISMQTFSNMLDFISGINSTGKDENEDIYASYGRLLNHTNNVVVVMTPSIVPYRGFEAMDQEIASIFSILGENNAQTFREKRADIGYSTGVATRYGFRVTETTSVEFGMFADAFSRFGYLGVFFYSILFALILAIMEKWCYNYTFKRPLLAMTLVSFLIYNGALNYMYSYYSFFKIVLVRGGCVILCMLLIEKFCIRKKYL